MQENLISIKIKHGSTSTWLVVLTQVSLLGYLIYIAHIITLYKLSLLMLISLVVAYNMYAHQLHQITQLDLLPLIGSVIIWQNQVSRLNRLIKITNWFNFAVIIKLENQNLSPENLGRITTTGYLNKIKLFLFPNTKIIIFDCFGTNSEQFKQLLRLGLWNKNFN